MATKNYIYNYKQGCNHSEFSKVKYIVDYHNITGFNHLFITLKGKISKFNSNHATGELEKMISKLNEKSRNMGVDIYDVSFRKPLCLTTDGDFELTYHLGIEPFIGCEESIITPLLNDFANYLFINHS